MNDILLIIVIVISVLIIALVLLNQSKGADDASAFGSANKHAAASSFSPMAKIIAGVVASLFVMVFAVHINNKPATSGLADRLEKKANSNKSGGNLDVPEVTPMPTKNTNSTDVPL